MKKSFISLGYNVDNALSKDKLVYFRNMLDSKKVCGNPEKKIKKYYQYMYNKRKECRLDER